MVPGGVSSGGERKCASPKEKTNRGFEERRGLMRVKGGKSGRIPEDSEERKGNHCHWWKEDTLPLRGGRSPCAQRGKVPFVEKRKTKRKKEEGGVKRKSEVGKSLEEEKTSPGMKKQKSRYTEGKVRRGKNTKEAGGTCSPSGNEGKDS